MTNNNRTPISFLQEVCSKKGIIPTYDVLSSEGPIHDPVFVIQCNTPNYSITAKGSSKKKAKHIASFLVLMNMFKNKDIVETEGCTIDDLLQGSFRALGENFLDNIDTSNLNLNFASEITNPEESNPIGKLQDMCRNNRWPMPIYDLETYQLYDKTLEYECTVKLWTWIHKATGISKKSAKKNAALKCYEDIVNNKLTIPQEALDSMENIQMPSEDLEDAGGHEGYTSKVTARALNGLFYEKPPKGKKNRMDEPPIINPCIQELQRIFDETLKALAVEANYQTIETKKGTKLCMITIENLFPQPIISSEEWPTDEEARDQAMRRSIIFLTSMSSKRPKINFSYWFNEASVKG